MISKAKVPYAGLLCLSDGLRGLLGKLLEKDPSTRAGVGDCLKHEFCAQARTDRIDELGYKFKRSEREIILSKNDVDMALSITRRGDSPKARTIRVTTSSASLSAPLTMPNLLHSFDDSVSGNDTVDDTKRGCAKRIHEVGSSHTKESDAIGMQSLKSCKSMSSRSIVQEQYSTLNNWCRNKLR